MVKLLKWIRGKLGKVNILRNIKTNSFTLNEPYSNTNFVSKCKILGHITTADNKFDEAVNGRIRKAKHAWGLINKKLIINKQLDSKIKFRLYNALILSILIYGLNTHAIGNKLIYKIQNFYAKCIRYIVNENYREHSAIRRSVFRPYLVYKFGY